MRLSLPLVLGATTVAITEGVRATIAGLQRQASPGAAIVAGLLTFGIAGLPFVLGAGVIALAAKRPEVTDLGRSVTSAFAGEGDDAHPSIGALFGAGLVALGAFASMSCGRAAARDGGGAALGVPATVAVLVVAVVVGGPLFALVSRTLGKRLRRAEARRAWVRRLANPNVLRLVGAALLCVSLRALVPRGFVIPVGIGVGAFVLLLVPRIAARVERRFGKLLWTAVFVVPTVLGVVTFEFVERTGTPVRAAMLYGAPLSSALMASVRAAFDHDHDSYAPVLLGRDCNDQKSTIHPGARELANDGIDQDCSGRDATNFVRWPAPAFVRPATLPPRPNIVLVQFDALRPDRLHFNGYSRPTSPNLDRFREDATLFTRAYTPAPSTSYAVASLFTGLDVKAFPQNRGPGNDVHLLPSAVTLAGRLGEIGYARMGFTISFVIQHVPGLGNGFDEWKTPWPLDAWEITYPVMATKTTDAAIDYLHGRSEEGSAPFFLFVHYACTHDPYGKDPRWKYGWRTTDDYDSAINYCDNEFGRLMTALDARKDAAATDIFLFSDHGEQMGEHGFWNHGTSLYEDAVRILLMTRIHGIAPRREVKTPVSLTDIHDTVLSLAGASPRGSPTASVNLLGYLTDGERPGDAERPIFMSALLSADGIKYQARGVLKGRYKLIYDQTAGTEQLFDVLNDPSEQSDLASQQPDEREQLASLVESWEAANWK